MKGVEEEEVSVPGELLSFPPLAVLTNGLVLAMNELMETVSFDVMDRCRELW